MREKYIFLRSHQITLSFHAERRRNEEQEGTEVMRVHPIEESIFHVTIFFKSCSIARRHIIRKSSRNARLMQNIPSRAFNLYEFSCEKGSKTISYFSHVDTHFTYNFRSIFFPPGSKKINPSFSPARSFFSPRQIREEKNINA